MKSPRILFIAFILTALAGCSITPSNDIYTAFPKGSKLTTDVLKKSKQVITVNNDIILLVAVTPNPDRYNPHLLFYDSSLNLQSASFIPAFTIDSIKTDTLYARLVPEKEKRKHLYRREIIPPYTITYIGESDDQSNNRSNKLIYALNIDGKAMKVGISFRESPHDVNTGFRKPLKTEAFTVEDSVTCDLNKVMLDYEGGKITITSTDASGKIIHDHMIVQSREIFDDFYSKLLERITRKRTFINE